MRIDIIMLLVFVKKERKPIGIEHLRKQCYGMDERGQLKKNLLFWKKTDKIEILRE